MSMMPFWYGRFRAECNHAEHRFGAVMGDAATSVTFLLGDVLLGDVLGDVGSKALSDISGTLAAQGTPPVD